MNKIIVIVFLISLTVGCESNHHDTECVHGTVIMSSCCTGSSFINLETILQLGIKTTLNGKEYANVIQVPGYLTTGNIYLNLRQYDPTKDAGLFPPISCYCLIAVGADVPIFVATGHSYSSCPEPGLKLNE
jgi:hypothetical protein